MNISFVLLLFTAAIFVENATASNLREKEYTASSCLYHGKWSDTSNGLIGRLSFRKFEFSKNDTVIIFLEIKNTSQKPVPSKYLLSSHEAINIRPNIEPRYTNIDFRWVYDSSKYRETPNGASEAIQPNESISAYCKIPYYLFQRDTVYSFDMKIDRISDSCSQLSNPQATYDLSNLPKWKGILIPGKISIHVKGHSIKKLDGYTLFNLLKSNKLTFYDELIIVNELASRKDRVVKLLETEYAKSNTRIKRQIMQILKKQNTKVSYGALVNLYYLADTLSNEVAGILTDKPSKEAERVYIDQINNWHERSFFAIYALGYIKSQSSIPLLDSIKRSTTDRFTYLAANTALNSIIMEPYAVSGQTLSEYLSILCESEINTRNKLAALDSSQLRTIDTNRLLPYAIDALIDLSLPTKNNAACQRKKYNFLIRTLASSNADTLEQYINDFLRARKRFGSEDECANGMLLHLIKMLSSTDKHLDFVKNLSRDDLRMYDWIVKEYVNE